MPRVKQIEKPMIEVFALEGHFGGVTYYMASLTLSECADQLHFARTNEASTFADRVQRRVNEKRAHAMFEDYLRKPGTRFFNSLVVVLMPKKGTETGYYRFEPFEDPSGDPIGKVGVLHVLSNIDRIVVDGQHRLYALRQANEYTRDADYEEDLELAEIEVPVVFITFDDVDGVYESGARVPNIRRDVSDRSRKVFIDLNKTAKPVDKNSLLILDDNDFSAIAARYLIENNPTLELYTKWSDAGSTLADADPYFTNIYLLDQYVDLLFPPEELDRIAKDYSLSLTDERNRAINDCFLAASVDHDGMVPRDMITDFFDRINFFNEWRGSIRSILNGDPLKQPEVRKLKTSQRKEIRALHHEHLMGTVAGQRAAFKAVVQAYQHLEEEAPLQSWYTALDRMSEIQSKNLYSRAGGLWLELLVRPGNRMKVNAVGAAADILEHLIRGVSADQTAGLIRPEDGIGTSNTMDHYEAGLKAIGFSK